MQYQSSVQVTRTGLGLDYAPVEYQSKPDPQSEPVRSEPASAQRYAPDKGYWTSSGYYDPARESLSYPPGWNDSQTGIRVDTWA